MRLVTSLTKRITSRLKPPLTRDQFVLLQRACLGRSGQGLGLVFAPLGLTFALPISFGFTTVFSFRVASGLLVSLRALPFLLELLALLVLTGDICAGQVVVVAVCTECHQMILNDLPQMRPRTTVTALSGLVGFSILLEMQLQFKNFSHNHVNMTWLSLISSGLRSDIPR